MKIEKIEIVYCITCNYRPIAATLAYMIEKELSVKPELVPSHESGIYEIIVNGEKMFSKTETGRFPENPAIIDMLKKLI